MERFDRRTVPIGLVGLEILNRSVYNGKSFQPKKVEYLFAPSVMIRHMGRPSDARERLIETGLKLFFSRSYDAVGVAELCEEAEVTKGSFYHFFPSKDDLGLAVIDHIWGRMRASAAEIAASESSPMARVRKLFDNFCQRMADCKKQHGRVMGCPFCNFAAEMSTQNERMRQKLAEVYDGISAFFAEQLDLAKAAGEIPKSVDSQLSSKHLIVLMQGMAVVSKTYNDAAMVQRLAGDAVAVACR